MICYLLKRKSSPHEWAATFDRKIWQNFRTFLWTPIQAAKPGVHSLKFSCVLRVLFMAKLCGIGLTSNGFVGANPAWRGGSPVPPVFSAARREKLWIRLSGTPASESSSFKSSLDPLSFRFVYSILSNAERLSGKSVSAPQPANAEAIRITHIASIVCRNDFIICSILSFDHRLFCKDYYTILA